MDRIVRRRKHRPGLKALGLMTLFQTLQRLSPRLGSFMAYQLWFHPGRDHIKHLAAFEPTGRRASHVKLNNKTIRYWHAGNGKVVFLMHGWAGCSDQMGPLAQGLLDAGYRVIWMDAPAHGRSDGWQTSLFEVARAMRLVQQREGPFHTVIAHSFGVPCSLYAMRHDNLQTDRLVAISAPASFDSLLDNYCKMIRANPRTRKHFQRRFAKFLGKVKLADIAPASLARHISQPALVIHDKRDRILGPEEGRLLHNKLPNARLLLTEKLGHSRILSDGEVIRQAVDFVKERTDQDTALVHMAR